MQQQPDDQSCGPTCLHGLYRFYERGLTLDDVMTSVRRLDHGGTLGVLLGLDAIRRGFDATLFTYNLDVFDPSWFEEGARPLPSLLNEQLRYKRDPRLVAAAEAYLEFLEAGGDVRHRELTPSLLAGLVRDGHPPIVGLSATYLYGCSREIYKGQTSTFDSVRGRPTGHFVVLSGIAEDTGRFRVSDPYGDNPRHGSGTYWVSPNRLLGAILLGVTTYDGNILVIRPQDGGP
ncbi:MAG: hypothetical protein HKN73_17775 [Gemmatimonadetes bacterium]|nr:hypothetical protein [Gemmatimonadota bacterium]